MHERCPQADVGIAVQRKALHLIEGLDKIGTAIGVDKVIAAMHSGRHRLITIRRRDAVGHSQHDRIPVRHHGDFHGVFGVMTIRHVDIVGQRRSRQRRTHGAQVDDSMGHAQTLRSFGCEFQFFQMALAIVEGNQTGQIPRFRSDMRKRNGIESARADDKCLHDVVLVF